jgi:hypothetical protein
VQGSEILLTMLLTTCITALRAARLCEVLTEAGIKANYLVPKWTNKRLPPPRIEIHAEIDPAQIESIRERLKNV